MSTILEKSRLALRRCRSLLARGCRSVRRMLGRGFRGKCKTREFSEFVSLLRLDDQAFCREFGLRPLSVSLHMTPHEVLRLRELRQQSASGGSHGSCGKDGADGGGSQGENEGGAQP